MRSWRSHTTTYNPPMPPNLPHTHHKIHSTITPVTGLVLISNTNFMAWENGTEPQGARRVSAECETKSAVVRLTTEVNQTHDGRKGTQEQSAASS